MRADPAEYELLAPKDLGAAVALMAEDKLVPIAGGTDLMVQFAAGILASKKLLNIWNLPELRRIDVLPEELQIGAGCTYTDLREHQIVVREFSLLALAASWTGGIANQNRGTLGGNIVNASPAADSLPALLVYDAELILTSIRGERRMPYREFHSGYKKMNLGQDELVRAICLPRRFVAHISYARKVGTRNAQAISKVCMAALAQKDDGVLRDVRIALGSVAPVPIRLSATEAMLNGKRLNVDVVSLARKTAMKEITPINDIRSTARYRGAVVGNLVAEFLETLGRGDGDSSAVLAQWNNQSFEEAAKEILPCCGSRAWAAAMAKRRPMQTESDLLAASDEVWRALDHADRQEAFRGHPRIGETPGAPRQPENRSSGWSGEEQSGVTSDDGRLKQQIAALNAEYEKRFGQVFLVCATGKRAAEILAIMRRRLQNDPQTEWLEMAEQQRQIMQIRIKKWLSGK